MTLTVKTTTTKLLSIALLSTLLAACGGGGGGGNEPISQNPVPPPIVEVPRFDETTPAQTSVADPVYADANRAAAFRRYNEIRQAAGLGLLRQNAQLDVAAQGHADYIRINGGSHYQEASRAGFTGHWPVDRAQAAGYAAPNSVVEVILPDPWMDRGTSADLVDGLISTPYHRMGMFLYQPDEVGVGYAFQSVVSGGTGQNVTIKIGSNPGQGAPSTPFVIWPLDGAEGVPVQGLPEWPNPIPENGGTPYGYPVSVQVHERKVLEVESFTLTTQAGEPVNVKLLHYRTDCNLQLEQRLGCAGYGARYFASIIGRQALAPDTVYLARFRGTIDGAPVDRSWSFRTAAN